MRGLALVRLLSLLALVLLAGVSGGVAAEVIHSFDSHVVLDKSGELTVTERIRVRAEGNNIKRGIYRDFPLTFLDAQGRRREVSFKLLGVTRDGRPERYFTERKGDVIRIYAGHKDVLLSDGNYTYEFRYRTSRQVRWFDGAAELNWNVTGNFWTFPILTASYRLELADRLRPVRWTAFTGPLGARGSNYRAELTADGALVVTTTRPLQAGEGLTVVAALPEGAVNPPTRATELWYAVYDNRGWVFGGLGFLLVLGYYLAAWNAVGRDPKGGTVIPLFHPPKGVSPALANYIDNWGLGRDKWRAFTAAALSLAVHGLLRFDDKDGKLTLKRTEKNPDGGKEALPPGERAIFAWVSSWGGSAAIDRANSTAVASVEKSFTSAVVGENKHRFFRRNLGYVLAGALMTVAVIAGVVIFGGLSQIDIAIIAVIAFGSVWLGMFLVPILLALFGIKNFGSVIRVAMTLIVLGIFVSIAAQAMQDMLPHGLSQALNALWSLMGEHPFPIALIASFATLNGLFLYLMRAPTALGRPIMDQLAGFKLYLQTAESDRLNLSGAPEITAERFEALLPYAVALDVEKPWSDAFASALQRAYPDEADPVDRHYRPNWHSGSWSGRSLGSAVASTVSSTASALSSAMPASSSSSGFSSGGGGSGGGGGGGGGGGW